MLWFEQDLFCAVNLWSILDWFARRAPATRLTRVYPAIGQVPGLGAMPAARLAALFAGRLPLTQTMLALGQQAWAAYASADPPLVARETAPLPFVGGAFRCHLGRFPSVANGLNEVENAALAVLRRGPHAGGDLFPEVRADPGVRRHRMGDVQFATACAAWVRWSARSRAPSGGSPRSAAASWRAIRTGWRSSRSTRGWAGFTCTATGRGGAGMPPAAGSSPRPSCGQSSFDLPWPRPLLWPRPLPSSLRRPSPLYQSSSSRCLRCDQCCSRSRQLRSRSSSRQSRP